LRISWRAALRVFAMDYARRQQVKPMSDDETPLCATCGEAHRAEACATLRAAAAAGAQPPGVPLRIYAGYVEARAALRANANGSACRVLEWLLGHVAEERGAPVELGFAAKLERLCRDGVISSRMQSALFERAVAQDDSPEHAWALMSVAEHAFARLYLAKSPR
jgi:hypothetical protein